MRHQALRKCALILLCLALGACSSTSPLAPSHQGAASSDPLTGTRVHLTPADGTISPSSVSVANSLFAFAGNPVTSHTFVQADTVDGDQNAVVVDGETFELYPEDQAAACPWQGTKPPDCGNSGAFRRIYSSPNAGWVDDLWLTPATSPTWPDTTTVGHVYVEGFLNNTTGQNTEAGFVYSRNQHRYLPYAKGPGGVHFVSKYGTLLQAGQWVGVVLQAVPCALTSGSCAKYSFSGTCAAADPKKGLTCQNDPDCQLDNNQCDFGDEFIDANWSSGSCCIMAQMMSLAQVKGRNDFSVGNDYGPIQHQSWAAASQSSSIDLMIGGEIFPNDPTKVITHQTAGFGVETEEINLHS